MKVGDGKDVPIVLWWRQQQWSQCPAELMILSWRVARQRPAPAGRPRRLASLLLPLEALRLQGYLVRCGSGIPVSTAREGGWS